MELDKNDQKETDKESYSSDSQTGRTFTGKVSPKPMTQLSNSSNKGTVVKRENVVKDATPPANKKKKALILILCALIILVLLITTLVITLPKPSRASDIRINFSTSASLGASVPGGSDDISKKLMPGSSMDCSFKISSRVAEGDSENENLDVFVRIRAYAVLNNKYYSNIFTYELYDNTAWYKGADGYYYYKNKLSPNQTIDAAKSLKLEPNISNEFAGQTIKIIFSAEALQAEYQAIVEYWPTASSEWSSNFK